MLWSPLSRKKRARMRQTKFAMLLLSRNTPLEAVQPHNFWLERDVKEQDEPVQEGI